MPNSLHKIMQEQESSAQFNQMETATYVGRCNFLATASPTVTNDATEGYSENSVWYKNTAPYELWICADETEGAAVWRQIILSNNFGALSPLTTKGDLLGYSTQNTRLGVGANNTVLTADSAETTGLKWANPLTVGRSVASGGANRILYENGSQNLAASSSFTFDGSNQVIGGIQIGSADASTGFWIRYDGTNSVISAKTGSINYGIQGHTGLQHIFYAGNPNAEVCRVEGSAFTLAAGAKIKGDKNAGGLFLDITNNADANAFFEISAAGAGDPKFYIYSGVARLALGGGNTEVASCYANGNFGVGTGSTAATEKLQVAGNVKINDAGNFVFGTTTGTKIGTASTQKIGFFGGTPAVQGGVIGDLDDQTGGVPAFAVDLQPCADPVANDNFATITVIVNAILERLRRHNYIPT